MRKAALSRLSCAETGRQMVVPLHPGQRGGGIAVHILRSGIGSGFDEQIQTPQPGTQAQGQNANQNQTAGKLDVVNAAEDPCAK